MIGLSLGYKCTSTIYAHTKGHRPLKKDGYKTCVFDLMLSNTTGVIQCIKDDFKDFCNLEYLTFQLVDKREMQIYNKKYRFLFNHESAPGRDEDKTIKWSSNTMYSDNNFEKFIERYNRRIQNFRDYLNSGQFVVFYLDTPFRDVSPLEQTISTAYPNLKFRINVVSMCDPVYSIAFLTNMGFREDEEEFVLSKKRQCVLPEVTDSIRVYYGIDTHKVDITQKVFQNSEYDRDQFYIHGNENVRASLFGDPCHGIPKNIYVGDKSYAPDRMGVVPMPASLIPILFPV